MPRTSAPLAFVRTLAIQLQLQCVLNCELRIAIELQVSSKWTVSYGLADCQTEMAFVCDNRLVLPYRRSGVARSQPSAVVLATLALVAVAGFGFPWL